MRTEHFDTGHIAISPTGLFAAGLRKDRRNVILKKVRRIKHHRNKGPHILNKVFFKLIRDVCFFGKTMEEYVDGKRRRKEGERIRLRDEERLGDRPTGTRQGNRKGRGEEREGRKRGK